MSMQVKAIESKRWRGSAMVAQTKDKNCTSRVLLLPMRSCKGEPIIANKIPFTTCMMDLTEQPGVANIANKVTQITKDYNCSHHRPLCLNLVKINGFLAPKAYGSEDFPLAISTGRTKTTTSLEWPQIWIRRGRPQSGTSIQS